MANSSSGLNSFWFIDISFKISRLCQSPEQGSAHPDEVTSGEKN
jgi:hypothetical protein